MDFAFAVVDTVRREEPELFDAELGRQIDADDASRPSRPRCCSPRDMLSEGVPGLSTADTREYLEYVADQRLVRLGLPKRFGSKNPFGFMELQDVQELSNFFERTVSRLPGRRQRRRQLRRRVLSFASQAELARSELD